MSLNFHRSSVDETAALTNGRGYCGCVHCAPDHTAPPRAERFRLAAAVAAARASYRELGAAEADAEFLASQTPDPIFATHPVMLPVGTNRTYSLVPFPVPR